MVLHSKTALITETHRVQNSSEESGVNNAIINLVESSSPKIIAHGKNVNVSQESTWPNIIYSVEMGEEYLGGIEIDVMITKDGKLILMHDPTFHNLSKGYNTSNEMRSQFILNNANIAEKRSLSDWDFNLFDEASYYEYKEVKDKFKIFDELSGYDFNIISLSELLKSLRSSDKLIVPNFEKTARAPPKSDLSKKIVDQYATEIKEVSLKNPIAIYIDFKPINNYTRRLYGLSDWHWIRNSWSDEQLRGFTTNSLRKLSEVLNINDGHKNSYIAVRHPEIAKICKSIDDKIIMMASPDNISNIDNADEFIAKFEPFKEFGPKLIEIKYLKHVTDPKIRHWARKNGFKIMFNNISQGDTTQFDGIYKDNQAQLIEDLLKEGGDIVIQTNTISELKNILRKIEKNKNSAFFKKIKCHFTYQTYGCFFTTYVEFYNGNDLANLQTG